MNALLGDVLEKAAERIEQEQIEEVRQQFGEKAVSQLIRMRRQQERHRNVMEVIETDEGTDIMHNAPIKLNPEPVEIDDYGETLRKMIDSSATDGLTVSVVDGCLRLVAVSSGIYQKLGRKGIAHTFYHLQFPKEECTLQRSDPTELERCGSIFPFFDLVGQIWLECGRPLCFCGQCPTRCILIFYLGVYGSLHSWITTSFSSLQGPRA